MIIIHIHFDIHKKIINHTTYTYIYVLMYVSFSIYRFKCYIYCNHFFFLHEPKDSSPQDDIYTLLYSHRTIFIHYCKVTGRYLYIIVQPQDDIYTLLYSHRTIFIHYCTVIGRYLYIIVQPQDDIYILLYSQRTIFIYYCTAIGRYLYNIVQPQEDIYILLYSHRTIFMGLYSN